MLIASISPSTTNIGFEAKSGEVFDLFTSKYAVFKGEQVPQGSGTLKGIAGVYNGKTQMMVSIVSDYLEMTSPRFESAAKLALQFTTKEVLCNAGSLRERGKQPLQIRSLLSLRLLARKTRLLQSRIPRIQVRSRSVVRRLFLRLLKVRWQAKRLC